jgi:hypothetical protein
MTELTGSTDVITASDSQATAYWQTVLDGELPTLHIPCDQKRPRERSFDSTILVRQIGKSLETRLAKCATDWGVSLGTVYFTALTVTLRRFSGQEDFLIRLQQTQQSEGASPVALPIRFREPDSTTLSELATKLESAIDSAERNADYWRDRADWSVAAESVPSEADGVPGQADFRFVDCTRTSATETTHTGRDSRPN